MWLTVSFHYTWALLREKRIKAKKKLELKIKFLSRTLDTLLLLSQVRGSKRKRINTCDVLKGGLLLLVNNFSSSCRKKKKTFQTRNRQKSLADSFSTISSISHTSCIALFLTLKFVTRMCRRCSTGINSHESRCSLSLVHVWAHSCIMFVFDLSPKQQSNYVLWSSVGRCCRGGGDATGQRSSITILMCIVSIAADESASIKSKKEERRSDDGEKAIN